MPGVGCSSQKRVGEEGGGGGGGGGGGSQSNSVLQLLLMLPVLVCRDVQNKKVIWVWPASQNIESLCKNPAAATPA